MRESEISGTNRKFGAVGLIGFIALLAFLLFGCSGMRGATKGGFAVDPGSQTGNIAFRGLDGNIYVSDPEGNEIVPMTDNALPSNAVGALALPQRQTTPRSSRS